MKPKFCSILLGMLGLFFIPWPVGAATVPNKEITTKPTEKPRSERIPIKDTKIKFKTSLSLTLPSFRIMILDDRGPVALLGLEVILEATTLEKSAAIHLWWIKLQSTIFEDLYGVAPFLWDTGYTPTVKSFQKRLLQVCRKILSADILRDVRVQKAYLRPLRAKSV